MPPAMVVSILKVDKGLLSTCHQYIQDIWHNTRALLITTTAKGTKGFRKDIVLPLDQFSQHSNRVCAVTRIYTEAATGEEVNGIILPRCEEDRSWWVQETLGWW